MNRRRSRPRPPRDHDVVYGRQPVLELLRAGRRQVSRVLLQASCERTPELESALAMARRAHITMEETDRRKLDALSKGAHHQGIAAETGAYPYLRLDERPPGGLAFWLLLDLLQDPQNLGSLLRTADAAGVTGVVIPSSRAAEVTPAVTRASAGAAEHVAVYRATNICRAMRMLREDGVRLYGLDAGEGTQPYTTADCTCPLGLVVGGEGQGLSRLVRETCDGVFHLPMLGGVASLNAAVAGAVALFEVVRQRGQTSAP